MKRLLIIVSLALLGVGAVFFYYWRQATQLPSWYTADKTTGTTSQSSVDRPQTTRNTPSVSQPSTQPKTEPLEVEQTQKNLNSKIDRLQKPPSRQPVNVELNEKELTTLFTSEVARKAQTSQFAKAVKGVNTTIENGKVESGAVVNLGSIPPEQLGTHEQAVVSKLVAVFPELRDRSVYIGLEGKPTVRNGQVELADDTRIRLGNLSFTPAELSQRLGIPEAEIRQQINLQLQLGGVKVSDFELMGDRALVKGMPN